MNKTICLECNYSVAGLHTSECPSFARDVAKLLTFTDVLHTYCEAIKADYISWNKPTANDALREIKLKHTEEFCASIRIVETKLYYKVLKSGSVHSFIVKEDGQFKRGDILKVASWNTPAKNQARGNIFGAYRVLWTGAEYLR